MWSSSPSLPRLVWQPPSVGVVKINVDVAVLPHRSMAACFCRDHWGDILHAETTRLHSVDPTVGEAAALWLGVSCGTFGVASGDFLRGLANCG